MPRSAISAGCVDRVLTPAVIVQGLLKLSQDAPLLWNRIAVSDVELPTGSEANQLEAILRLLRTRRGVDFSDYKPTTIKRRMVRQMMLSKCAEIKDYLSLSQSNRDEIDKLYESLLINVTEFFRDPEYFDFLREHILPQLLAHHEEHVPIRIWVPGCSTGEEAYSLGIILRELLDEKSQQVPMQIFGTDVSDRAITVARAGLYSMSDVANVSPDRLKRFFHQTDRGYVVQRWIRDMCIFARQNVGQDSPFSRLDLISCRNLLIYFGPKLQRKLFPLFHFSLNPSGYLVLGSSESVGENADLFRLIDRRYRIYLRKSTGRRAYIEFPGDPAAVDATPLNKVSVSMPEQSKESVDIIREADRIDLLRHGPTGVLVNDDLDIVQFRGDVSAYLAPTSGRASLNLFRMARDGLAGELQAVLGEAREKNVRVHRDDISIVSGEGAQAIHIDVTPIDTAETRERFYLVLFSKAGALQEKVPETPGKGRKSGERAQVEQLRQDLEATRTYLQAAIQKHETTNQELRAANEEIQSSNEELQSTNEELETAKEELQSTNEELTTVNEELHSRQLDLIQVNNDLHNLINKIDGVVLTLIDVGTMKATLAEVEETRNLAQAVIETTREPLAALTPDLKIKTANAAFYRLFKTTKERAEGNSFFEIIAEPEKLDALKPALEAILPTNSSLTNYEVGIDLPEAGPTALVINVRQIASAARTYPLILLSLRPR